MLVSKENSVLVLVIESGAFSTGKKWAVIEYACWGHHFGLSCMSLLVFFLFQMYSSFKLLVLLLSSSLLLLLLPSLSLCENWKSSGLLGQE